MVKLSLKIKMEVDNVTDIRPADDFDFTMNVQCSSCREEHANAVTMSPKEEHELSGSRGTAHFVWRCPHCKKEHSASFLPASSSDKSNKSLIGTYTSSNASFQPLITLDCRGLEPTSFLFNSGRGGNWLARADDTEGSVKKAEFEIELDEEGRWDDYDDANMREVGVREIEAKWERA